MQRGALLVLLASLLFPATAGADAIDDLTPGTWYEIPNSKMRDVCPPDSPDYEYSYYCAGVINAWGGAALDTTRGRMLLWGGGHGDYKGNEVYAFDLTTLTWERIWGPTPDAQIPSGGTHEEYDDGNPGSRHTYSGLSYVPAPVDAMISMGGALWQSGSFGVGTWRLDLGTPGWQRMTDGPGEQGYGDPSEYDPQTQHVFRRANSRMLEYDPVGDTFTDRAESNGGFYLDDVSSALDPTARLMVMMGEDRVDLYRLDSDEYSQDVAVNGPLPPDMGQAPGLAFDSQQQKFVVWTGGATTYTFDPAASSFSQHDNPNGTPPGPVTPSGGVFGRFRYVPSRNVFVSINSVDENVFVLRMSEGTGEPLPPPPDGGSGGGAGVGNGVSGGGGGSGTGGNPSTGGANSKPDSGSDDGGCGCRVERRDTSGLALGLALCAIALLRRRPLRVF